jgi:hypothetical protein
LCTILAHRVILALAPLLCCCCCCCCYRALATLANTELLDCCRCCRCQQTKLICACPSGHC